MIYLLLHPGIYYHLYKEGSTVNNASQKVRELTQDDTFTASVVLVVTWHQVRQGRYRAVDFQPDQVSDKTVKKERERERERGGGGLCAAKHSSTTTTAAGTVDAATASTTTATKKYCK